MRGLCFRHCLCWEGTKIEPVHGNNRANEADTAGRSLTLLCIFMHFNSENTKQIGTYGRKNRHMVRFLYAEYAEYIETKCYGLFDAI